MSPTVDSPLPAVAGRKGIRPRRDFIREHALAEFDGDPDIHALVEGQTVTIVRPFATRRGRFPVLRVRSLLAFRRELPDRPTEADGDRHDFAVGSPRHVMEVLRVIERNALGCAGG